MRMLLLENAINYEYPFTIIEIMDNQPLKFKVRYSDNDLDKVRQKYCELDKLISNPIIVFNGYITDITENRNDIQTKIIDIFSKWLFIIPPRRIFE